MGTNPHDSFRRWIRGQKFTTLCVTKAVRNHLNSVVGGINSRKDGGSRISVNFLLEYCLDHLFYKDDFIAQIEQAALAHAPTNS